MSYLVDTNVLLRSVQQTHPMQSEAKSAINLLLRKPEIVSLIPRNLIEFWAVATRPEINNDLGLPIEETIQQVIFFKSVFTLLPEL